MISFIIFLCIGVYAVFIIQLIVGFNKVKPFDTTHIAPKTTFSILIPFRNEEKNLSKLLNAISKLNYPKELFEIIAIDDNSRDKSAQVFNQWRFQNGLIQTTLLDNLRLSNSPKKDALMRAIPVVKNKWIVTTDADCVVKENWLMVLDNFIQNTNAQMVVGAVIYKTKNNWFHHFQQLDLLALQGVTIGSFGIEKPFMCNGANFAYTKELFTAIGGFTGYATIASGDDVFLLQKAIAHAANNVKYLKNEAHIVQTKPENDLYKLFMQRVRWAAKSTQYNSIYAKALAVVTFLANLSLVSGFVFYTFGLLNLTTLFIAFLIKYTVEYIIILKTNRFLSKQKWIFVGASALLYPLFAVSVALYSLVGNFNWKGRKFKK